NLRSALAAGWLPRAAIHPAGIPVRRFLPRLVPGNPPAGHHDAAPGGAARLSAVENPEPHPVEPVEPGVQQYGSFTMGRPEKPENVPAVPGFSYGSEKAHPRGARLS